MGRDLDSKIGVVSGKMGNTAVLGDGKDIIMNLISDAVLAELWPQKVILSCWNQ